MRSVSPRVLILSHAAELGGAEIALLRLLDAMPPESREGVLVCVFADGPFSDELRRHGVRVHHVLLRSRTRELSRHDLGRPLTLVRAFGDVGRLLIRLGELARQHDLVQTASMKAHLIGIPVAFLSRRPLVWYLHDRLGRHYLTPPVRALMRLTSRLPTAVIVNSASTARTVPRDTHLIYPGFSPEQAVSWSRVESRQGPSSPVFLLLGRISETKGQEEFVRAARLVSRSHPTARFRIVGSPMFGQEDYAEHVRALAVELDIDVEWVGFSRSPQEELDRASVLVHASPVPEPFGQVILEACIRGVPVIATDAGGVPEILGPDAALVPPGDVPALAHAMEQAIDQPEATRERALHAYQRATAIFPLAISAERLERLWARTRANSSHSATRSPRRTRSATTSATAS